MTSWGRFGAIQVTSKCEGHGLLIRALACHPRIQKFSPASYVVPLGISRGEVSPSVIAWKIAVIFVML